MIQLAFLVACLYTAVGVFRLGVVIRFLRCGARVLGRWGGVRWGGERLARLLRP